MSLACYDSDIPSTDGTAMAIFPGAKAMIIQHNFQPWMRKPLRGLIIHIDGGAWVNATKTTQAHFAHGSINGVFGEFNTAGKGKSAHFGVDKEGNINQFLDTSKSAFAVDGTYDGVDSHWVSVENIAVPGEELTDAQIESCADIFRWLHQTEGVPLRLAGHSTDKGLAYHSLFLSEEGAKRHPCPTLKVINQLPDIVDAALAFWGN
ncbi:MAG TPA: N-acetylmuramoyl-L-alanine amidase [Gemmatimonadaceae bacterium]|nr:N-acetylmuramoyl-L-alanine amidase [Gemmatimonadaceae bacterium]